MEIETYKCIQSLNMSPKEYDETDINRIRRLLTIDTEVKKWEAEQTKKR